MITSTKTAKSRREVPITDRTAAILQELRARQVAERDRAGSQEHDTGYVFTTAFGEPSDPRNAHRALKLCEIGVQAWPDRARGRLPERKTASDLQLLWSG